MNVRPCVSVVIVTFESGAEISSCLDALSETAKEWLRDTIVVDNASNDGTAHAVQTHDSQASLVSKTENVGFGRAMNQGSAQARGEYLLLLNPDCTVLPGAVAELAHFLDHHPNASACGPMIVNRKGQFDHCSRRGFPTPLNSAAYMLSLNRIFPRNRAAGGYQHSYLDSTTEGTTDALSGACMMVRRRVFEEVKGFDEDYFLFGEDIDLCWKICEAGHEIWYIPSARVQHVKGASMRSAPKRAQKEFHHSMRLFVEKHLSSKYSPLSLALIKSGINVAEWWTRVRSR